MSEATTEQQFIDALQVLERDREPTQMIGLFTENSETGNVVSSREFCCEKLCLSCRGGAPPGHGHSGSDGARAFWVTYRNTFGEVASSFRNVIVGDGRAALEWTTTGTSPTGAPIAYEGVSILEMADGKITRFRAYFDSHDLGLQIEQAAQKR